MTGFGFFIGPRKMVLLFWVGVILGKDMAMGMVTTQMFIQMNMRPPEKTLKINLKNVCCLILHYVKLNKGEIFTSRRKFCFLSFSPIKCSFLNLSDIDSSYVFQHIVLPNTFYVDTWHAL